jgi:Papain-like cysteine protease AvrRpt2
MRWNVPMIAQTNTLTCWEAVGHMMWLFRYPGDEIGYKKAASKYIGISTGLDLENTDTFYRTLGMVCRRDANESFIRHSLYLGPLVVMIGLSDPQTSHAEVLVGLENHEYILNNPQAVERVNFDGDDPPQTAGEVRCLAADFQSQSVWWWPHKHKDHHKTLK